MNHIEMYTSSSQLRVGLHRVLATSHAFSHGLTPGDRIAWWSELPAEHAERARLHRLDLETLAPLFREGPPRAWIDTARRALALPPLNDDAVGKAFRHAIISGRAHRAHQGRDVYGISNKALWDLLCGPFGAAVSARFGASLGEGPIPQGEVEALPEGVEEALGALIAFDTSPKGEGHGPCIAWLTARLTQMGFEVEVLGEDLGRPLLVARRGARGLRGSVVLYGHYDTTPFGRASRWAHPPRELTLQGGRLHGRGVADNKGPLAARLTALGSMTKTPALTWIIQGEEETGSAVAHRLLPEVMAGLRPTLWLEETGYHDHEDGTLRLLARQVGQGDANRPPTPEMRPLLRALLALSSRWGVAARVEHRGLNKSVVAGGCPFNRNLPPGAPYLAVGVNDSLARIHADGESLPIWTFPLHAAELEVIFHGVEQMAGARP